MVADDTVLPNVRVHGIRILLDSIVIRILLEKDGNNVPLLELIQW